MRRPRLFEFEDQTWFPARLRDAGTAYLRLAAELAGHPRLLAARLAELLRATGTRRIVDLGSGGGGPIAGVVQGLRERGLEVTATLTDRFPNAAALGSVAARAQGIDFELRPVDARAVAPELEGLRTLFNTFHHFTPRDARRILEDAARAGQPIAIFEEVGDGDYVFEIGRIRLGAAPAHGTYLFGRPARGSGS